MNSPQIEDSAQHLTSGKTPPSRFFYGYIVVLAALVIMLIGWGAYYSFGVFFEPLLDEFGWTRATTSVAYSLCILLAGLLSIFIGGLSDRFGPRLTMSVCGLFFGLGLLLMSQITTLWQIYLFYGVIVAIGIGAICVIPPSTTARWFVKRRGMMLGIVLAGAGLGGTIIAPAARWLISNYEWRLSYVVLGIATLILTIFAAQFLRQEPRQMGLSPYGGSESNTAKVTSETKGLSLRQASRTLQFWLLGAMYFCHLYCAGSMTVHLVIYATGQGISAATAVNVLAIILGVSVASRIVIGIVADRIGNRLAFVIAFTLTSIAFVWLQLATGPWTLYLFAVIFGFGYGSLFSLFPAMIAELFGTSSHGAIYGAITFLGTMGEASGAPISGYIFDTTGSYQIAFLICGLVSITGMILTLLIRPITSVAATKQ